jgi:hypothetical protein
VHVRHNKHMFGRLQHLPKNGNCFILNSERHVFRQ